MMNLKEAFKEAKVYDDWNDETLHRHLTVKQVDTAKVIRFNLHQHCYEHFQEVVDALQAFVDSSSIEYVGEQDEIGSCIHCGKLSYKHHYETCPITIANKVLAKVKEVPV